MIDNGNRASQRVSRSTAADTDALPFRSANSRNEAGAEQLRDRGERIERRIDVGSCGG
jgi:hypothetical protein